MKNLHFSWYGLLALFLLSACVSLDKNRGADLSDLKKIYVPDLKMAIKVPPQFKLHRGLTLFQETLKELEAKGIDEYFQETVRRQFANLPEGAFLLLDTLSPNSSMLVFPIEEFVPVNIESAHLVGKSILQQASLQLSGTGMKARISNVSMGKRNGFDYIRYEIEIDRPSGGMLFDDSYILSREGRSIALKIIAPRSAGYDRLLDGVRLY
ncbi:MAG: hypothetical protein ACFB10_21920 [Salibacteraceae bacterium]